MKKLLVIFLFCVLTFGINAQNEYNGYEYSQKFKNWLFNDGYVYMLEEQLQFDLLLSFTREDLRILRNYIYAKYNYTFLSSDLSSFFSKFRWYRPVPGNVDNQLTEIDKINIQIIQELENNFPSANEIEKIVGVWREYGAVPDQGYIWGDYLIMYPNGTFEYKFRTFNAIRHVNQIYGGSRYGLWTFENNQSSSIDYINISEIYKASNGLDETRIYNKRWWNVSRNIFDRLDWGTIR